jgi:hypothetical protein
LLGERDISGEVYPWLNEKVLDNGDKDWKPVMVMYEDGKSWIDSNIKEKGVDLSLDLISRDIDDYLSQA